VVTQAKAATSCNKSLLAVPQSALQVLTKSIFSKRSLNPYPVGAIPNVHQRQLHPEISAAVFASQPPQLIRPVITDVGIHLIHVEEIIQPQLDRLLHQQIMMDMFERWIEQQIEIVSPQISIEF
jgi:parvulin-like peptidyl-prolyl isomerase